MDILAGTIHYLGAQAEVSSLVDARIFGEGLPADESVSMPRKAIVLNKAGGFQKNDRTDLLRQRLDVFCYGETAIEAGKLAAAVALSMQRLSREVHASVLLDAAVDASGGTFFKDQDGGRWPVDIQSWLVLGRSTVPMN